MSNIAPTTCPNCGEPVAEYAPACPNCGEKAFVETPADIKPTRHRPMELPPATENSYGPEEE